MSKFDELKKAAEAVPELPWEVTGHTVYALEHDSWRKGVAQMRNRFSFSVQRGPDTPESELQAIAEFCQAANPAAVLELLAIQVQLVEDVKEILASLQAANDDCDGPITDTIWMRGARNETVFEAIENALAAAGAQP